MKITSYKQISTKKGDKGFSKDYSNNEYSKDDILFEILGNIDELSSSLGVAYHYSSEQVLLKSIQTKLQDINSLIATSNLERRTKLTPITNIDVEYLEQVEEDLIANTEIKPVFVLPGSDTSKEGAYIDLSRAITRRCERSLVRFIRTYERTDLDASLMFLNRLSDVLFVLSRNKSVE